MAHHGIIFIDCIIITAYYVTLFCIISQFKQHKYAGILLLTIYQMLSSITSWIQTYDEGMPVPNTDVDVVLIIISVDIIFCIVFFTVFMKGNPFVNYCVYIITDTFNVIMLFLSVKLRELLTPNLSAPALVTDLTDWPVLIFEFFAYAGTIVIAFLFIPKLKKILEKIPVKLLYVIFCLYLFSNFILFGILVFNAEIITKHLIATIAIVLVVLALVLLLFIFTIRIYQAEKLQKQLILQEMERQQQFYSSLYKTGVRLRHLKHDLANHQAVMDLTEGIDKASSEKYRQQILTHYQELTEEINKSKLERI